MTEFQGSMCPACAAGYFEECHNPKTVEGEDRWIIPCAQEFSLALPAIGGGGEKGQVGRPVLAPGEVTDAKSTGRKRAALIMPFLEGRVCDWANLRHAGGGVIPILGCMGNTIADVKSTAEANERGADEVGHRHHGPDKNTLNNTPGVNLHGVCSVCHTRWHALNDPFYDEDGRPTADKPFVPVEPYYPHDAVSTFTEEEWEMVEQWWDLPVAKRGPYPINPEETAKKVLPLLSVSATLDEDDNPFPGSPFSEIGDSA